MNQVGNERERSGCVGSSSHCRGFGFLLRVREWDVVEFQ